MPPKLCHRCGERRAALRRPKTFEQLCKECFYTAFEQEIHETIVEHQLFQRGERVAIAASGGKDSTVLAHVLTLLNQQHDYGLDLFLLSIDEGINGYRDDSLETVKRNEAQYGIPLHVYSYKDLYGWTMDEIVAEVGTRNNCTFCGVFRRQALDRAAALLGADKMATGHNADDLAETVMMNIVWGDVSRLGRCTNIVTGEGGPLPRIKPFKYCYQKEIVMYAYFKKLDYFSTECIYAQYASRIRFAREFVKGLEAARPQAVLDLIRSAELFRVPRRRAAASGGQPRPSTCTRCGYLASEEVCKACQLLEGLNRGLPRLGIGRPKAGMRVRGTSAASAAAPAAQAVLVAAHAAAAGAAGCGNGGDCQHMAAGCGRCSSSAGQTEGTSATSWWKPSGATAAAAAAATGAAASAAFGYVENMGAIPAHPSARV